MRSDIAKVLVERPRVGGVGKENSRRNRRATKQALDHIDDANELDVWSFHGMKRVHTSLPGSYDDKKQLNENLQPLRRFLHSRIGKPWSEVYSEIMANLNLNNSVQYHVFQHLTRDRMVETNTYLGKSGKVIANTPSGPTWVGNHYFATFYVDPTDGTLQKCENSAKARNRYNKEVPNKNGYFDKKNPLVQWHKVKGVWYEYKMRRATADEQEQSKFGRYESVQCWLTMNMKRQWVDDYSVFLEQIINESTRWQHWNRWAVVRKLFGDYLLPISKRQISSKEVKRIEALIAERDGEA
jgi:hypothetical protein